MSHSNSSLFLRTGYSLVNCKLHPVVLFNILDHFSRRPETQHRVIGTLLGVSQDGFVEIRNSFPVPHTEQEKVEVEMDFHRTMYELHHKANPQEVIVGWYSTGTEINENSVVIHDLYSRELNQPPVHLLMETNLSQNNLSVKAFVNSSSSVFSTDTSPIVSHFLPIQLDLSLLEAERLGLEVLMRQKEKLDGVVPLQTDLSNLESSMTSLHSMIEEVETYINRVLKKEIPENKKIGRLLADTVASLPRFDKKSLEKLLNTSLQDVLMVVYLASLTKAQLALAEKLQASA